MNKTIISHPEICRLVTLIRPLQLHRSGLPVLQSVRFEPSADGQATAFATNLDNTVIVPGTASQSSGGGHLSVPFALLQRLAKEADGEGRRGVVSFTVAEGKVKAEWTTQGVPMEQEEDVMPLEQFPAVDTRGFTKGMAVSADFRDLLNAARASISTDETRYVLNGVFFDDAAQRVVSTDGRRMFAARPAVKLPCRAIVPTLALEHLLKGEAEAMWFKAEEPKAEGGRRKAEGDEEVPMNPQCPALGVVQPAVPQPATHGMARLKGGALLVFRCLEGNYPNWKQVVPGQAHYRIAVAEPAELLKKLQAVKAGKKDESQSDLEVQTNGAVLMRLRLKGCTPGGWMNVGRSDQTVPVPVNACYNTAFLNEALASVVEPVIYLTDEISPAMIVSTDLKRQVVLMPMRVAA